MNKHISSWLLQGAFPLALACLTGPALAGRTVTSSDSGGGGANTVASGNPNTCGVADFLVPADFCGGFFDHGEDSNAVQALVTSYAQNHPNMGWGSATQVYSQVSGGPSTNPLFTTAAGNDVRGNIFFQQDFAGSFVVALSGTWAPDSTTLNNSARANWSAYYLFDDVIASAASLQRMSFGLYGTEAPDQGTNGPDFYVMRGLSVDKVSIYQYAVPEPSSLLLGALALGVLGAAAARTRRRRSSTGTERAN